MKKLKQTHDILLHLLDELPDAEAADLRAELALLYGALLNATMSYEAVAGRIRSNASVHKRRLTKNFALTGRE